MEFKEKKKITNKGITLIALVITIIVLLILAGVAISTLTGNNGLLEKTSDAKDKSDIGAARERTELYVTEFGIDYRIQENPSDTLAEYISYNLNGKDAYGYKISTDGNNIVLTKGGKIATKGTIGEGGEIVWEDVPSATPVVADSVQSLAQSGAIKRWDKINYNPGSGTTANIDLPEGASIEGTKLASLNLPAGATLDGTIVANSATNWVILDVDQSTGKVLIMPKIVSDVKLKLEGKNGYNNAIEAINMVAGIYKNNNYAASARGLKAEDINKVMNYTPESQEATSTWNNRYGMDLTTLDITDAGEGQNPSQTYTSTSSTGSYWYPVSNVFGRSNGYFLASRCVCPEEDICFFEIAHWAGGSVGFEGLFSALGPAQKEFHHKDCSEFTVEYPVLPVVTLKPDAQLESTQTFYTETATATVSVSNQDDAHSYEHNTWTFK